MVEGELAQYGLKPIKPGAAAYLQRRGHKAFFRDVSSDLSSDESPSRALYLLPYNAARVYLYRAGFFD